MQPHVFGDFASVDRVTAQPHAAELFGVLARFREAVRGGLVEWSDFGPVQEYAGMCFWAIRKLEYSFAAEAVAAVEAQVDADAQAPVGAQAEAQVAANANARAAANA